MLCNNLWYLNGFINFHIEPNEVFSHICNEVFSHICLKI